MDLLGWGIAIGGLLCVAFVLFLVINKDERGRKQNGAGGILEDIFENLSDFGDDD